MQHGGHAFTSSGNLPVAECVHWVVLTLCTLNERMTSMDTYTRGRCIHNALYKHFKLWSTDSAAMTASNNTGRARPRTHDTQCSVTESSTSKYAGNVFRVHPGSKMVTSSPAHAASANAIAIRWSS